MLICTVALCCLTRIGGYAAGAGLPTAASTNDSQCLTAAQQVRLLRPEEARLARPVRLRGVITYHEPEMYLTFIQDETAGTYVGVDRDADRSSGLDVGQLVELEGVTSPGKFAPFVEGAGTSKVKTTVLARAPPPAPIQLSFDQLSDPRHHCQWIEVRGVVRSVNAGREPQDGGRIILELGTVNGAFRAVIPGFRTGDPLPLHLVDAEVRMRGVFGSIVNGRRQLIGMRLFVPTLAEVDMVRAPPVADPFELPVRPVNVIMQFSAEESTGHRVRVQGTVTLQQPGRGLFIRGEGGGLWIQSDQLTAVVPGDYLDIAGFPARGDFNPSLENSVFQVIRSGPEPEPVDFAPENGFSSQEDAELVRVEAVVLDQMHSPGQFMVIAQAGQTTFSATLENDSKSRVRIPNGSKVRLTGVCSVRANEFRIPQTFRLLLRSPRDVVVLQRPQWWTVQRVLWIAGGLTMVMLIAVAWSVVLAQKNVALNREIRERHDAEDALQQARERLEQRVDERTRQLSEANEALRDQITVRERAEARLVAVQLQHLLEQERARIARDIHDDLGARLTQIKLLSELVESHASDRENVERHTRRISSVTRELTQSMDEIVWAVDPRNDTLESLTTYLYKFAQDYLGMAGIRCRLDAPVDLPDTALSADVRHHLFLAFKESLNNIVKHATATEVWIRLRVERDTFNILIEDNGCGLASGNDRGANGHGGAAVNGNGLGNMRKRIEAIGGTFELASHSDQGTRLKLSVGIGRTEILPAVSPVPHTGD